MIGKLITLGLSIGGTVLLMMLIATAAGPQKAAEKRADTLGVAAAVQLDTAVSARAADSAKGQAADTAKAGSAGKAGVQAGKGAAAGQGQAQAKVQVPKFKDISEQVFHKEMKQELAEAGRYGMETDSILRKALEGR